MTSRTSWTRRSNPRLPHIPLTSVSHVVRISRNSGANSGFSWAYSVTLPVEASWKRWFAAKIVARVCCRDVRLCDGVGHGGRVGGGRHLRVEFAVEGKDRDAEGDDGGPGVVVEERREPGAPQGRHLLGDDHVQVGVLVGNRVSQVFTESLHLLPRQCPDRRFHLVPSLSGGDSAEDLVAGMPGPVRSPRLWRRPPPKVRVAAR